MTTFDDRLDHVLGQKTAEALAKGLGLTSVGDLLRHYPRRYAERGELTSIAGLEIGEHATVLAEVRKTTTRRMKTKYGSIVESTITDGQRSMTIAFFNQQHRAKDLVVGRRGLFAGKVTSFNGALQLAHPDYKMLTEDEDDSVADEFAGGLIPVYPATKGIESWVIERCVRQVLDQWDGAEDPLPEVVRRKHGLADLSGSLRKVHRPANWGELNAARERLKWDEALAVQLVLAQRKVLSGARPAPRCAPRPDGVLAAFDTRLPFQLTEGQAEVGEQIAHDLTGEHPMNRLLQGEVGSGKTIVALRAMLQAVDAGRQAALLAPTEVLAAQHARSLSDMLGDLVRGGELGAPEHATRLTLLTGSMGAKERKQALLDIVSGTAGIVVGTHALIQDKVAFADLGLVVVDEQHRFGVEQRDALRTRAGEHTSPHVLVMTATPIPRTVAMTVYGDLEVSALRQLPQGRSPISTNVVPVAEKPAWLERVWQRIREEVAAGHQAYVVCPRIGEAEAGADDLDGTELDGADDPTLAPPEEDGKGGKGERRQPVAVMDVAPKLAAGPLRGLTVGVLHGKLPPEEKDTVMRAFAANEVQVLVATTVVEVGVNVPNATVMAILDADRFGVSQLHQLRGRVGRGSAAGLCLLVSEVPGGTSTRERLDAVAATTDGFELAQMDLELRHEGDILGAAQSGKKSALRMLSLLRDEEVIATARTEAVELLTEDPELSGYPGLAGLLQSLVAEDKAEYLEKA
ncbi:ATP-dependent DNA helicase RecG [Crossiella equi]|uniref:Probable DNA 3'-5' helicase RecG n=1 Tax=Crossiella equi TaxID=130796 RepID=A0ABS5AL50_9PSEU|nr:ATP-dependent DNA helicase RecG [Crossiella equi]MBP2476987.1 ATP-dependent DNA helicase RecG [Crossiella equi]